MNKPGKNFTLCFYFIFIIAMQFLLFRISPELGNVFAESSVSGVSRILYINSHHRGDSRSDEIESGLREVFETEGSRIELSTEYLDTRRFADPGLLDAAAGLMADKFAGYPFDLLIVSDNAAFDFSVKHRGRLFPDIPIVFCGYDNFRPEVLKGMSDITGVNEKININDAVETALVVHPETKTLVFITSTEDEAGRRISEIVEQSVFPEYGKRFNPVVLKDVSLEEVRHGLEQLPRESLVFLCGRVRDTGKDRAAFVENGLMISDISPFPVYTLWNYHLGAGVIGGHIISAHKQGTEAANLALRILDGTPPDAIPVVMNSSAEDVFDFTVMKRFGISEAMLPKGARVLKRPGLVLTDAEQDWLKRNPHIKFVAAKDQPPFSMKDSDGAHIGILPDLFDHLSRAIGQELGFEMPAIRYPHARARKKGMYGNATTFKTPVTQKRYLLTDAYLHTVFYIYTSKNNIKAIGTSHDLKGKKVAVLKGHLAQEAYLDNIGGIGKVFVHSPLEQIQKVSAGEADAMMGYVTYPYLLRKHIIMDLAIAYIAETQMGIHVGVNPEHPILHGILNKAISTLGEKTRNDVLAKWMRISRNDAPQIELTRDETAWLKAHPVIRFSNETDRPPFDFAESVNPRGYSVDYIRLLERKIPGVEFRFINGYTGPEFAKMLEEREIDVLHCVAEAEKDKSFTLFTAPYIHPRSVIVARKDRPDIASVGDIDPDNPPRPLRMGVRSDWPIFRGILDKALDAVSPDEVRKIKKKWFGEPETREPLLSLGKEEKDWLASHPRIRMGIMNAWPPMDFVDETGKPRGIGVDYIHALNKRLGSRIVIVPVHGRRFTKKSRRKNWTP